MRRLSQHWGAALAGVAFTLGPCPIFAQPGAHSRVTAFDARLITQGAAAEIGPVAPLSGAPDGPFTYSETLATVSQTSSIGRTGNSPRLTLQATRMTSGVASRPGPAETRIGQGDNAIESLHMELAPAGGPPALVLDGREVVSSATLTTSAATRASGLGIVSVGKLALSGPLLGGHRLDRSGPATPNMVVYASPTVTITLNRQLKAAGEDCGEECSGISGGIVVVAIDIELRNAPAGLSTVSGHIRVGQAIVQ